MVDHSNIGRRFAPVSYCIEANKVNEFLTAIGEDNPDFLKDKAPLPPTITTLVSFWGGGGLEITLRELDVNIWDVLHGEQEYDYLQPIFTGDTISSQTNVENIYNRAGMEFIQLFTEMSNQHGQTVLKERSLIIVRS